MLLQMHELPGADLAISARTRELLKSATVRLVRHPKVAPHQPHELDREGCTGVKIRMGRSTFVSTASHCFSDAHGVKNGRVSGDQWIGHPDARAADFVAASGWDHGIVDPRQPIETRWRVADVTGLMVTLTRIDHALLRVRPVTGPNPRPYVEIAAVQRDRQPRRPMRGQPVSITGVPGASGNTMVTRTGTYLGRATTDYGDESLDLVAVPAASAATDPCHYGASGGSFIADTKSGPYLSGPLSIRNNVSFDIAGDRSHQMPDPAERARVNESQFRATRHFLSQALQVQIPDDHTVCGFAVTSVERLRRMWRAFRVLAEPRQ